MNSNIYHITNGDALTERLKHLNIDGVVITMRECLIEGPTSVIYGNEVFFENREKYLNETFKTDIDYKTDVRGELEKIYTISDWNEVYFWFEDDLFCQSNLWFLLYYLRNLQVAKYLVRAGDDSPYSFAGLSNNELLEAPNYKIELEERALKQLWDCYSNDDLDGFNKINKELENKYPFISRAFDAHIDRLPKQNYLGRPKEVLKQLTLEMGLKNFGAVFKSFQKRLPFYGYGDLQVRIMLNELEKNKKEL